MSAMCSGLPGMWLWQADFILRHTEMIEIQTDRDIQLYRYIHISQQFSTFLCREKAPKGLPTALQGKWHAVIYLVRDKPEKERRGEIQSSAELHWLLWPRKEYFFCFTLHKSLWIICKHSQKLLSLKSWGKSLYKIQLQQLHFHWQWLFFCSAPAIIYLPYLTFIKCSGDKQSVLKNTLQDKVILKLFHLMGSGWLKQN